MPKAKKTKKAVKKTVKKVKKQSNVTVNKDVPTAPVEL